MVKSTIFTSVQNPNSSKYRTSQRTLYLPAKMDVSRRNHVTAMDLRKSWQAWANFVNTEFSAKMMDFLFLRNQGSWPDNAHISPEYIEQLRQLINGESAQNVPNARYVPVRVINLV